MELIAEPLTPEAFAPFGEVLRRDPSGELFQPLHVEGVSQGWRVAILAVAPGPLPRIHRHPDSEECFSPLTGAACMAVASPESPDRIRLFRLTEPVCVRRNVWHELVAAERSTVFIAENARITGDPQYLNPPVPWRG